MTQNSRRAHIDIELITKLSPLQDTSKRKPEISRAETMRQFDCSSRVVRVFGGILCLRLASRVSLGIRQMLERTVNEQVKG